MLAPRDVDEYLLPTERRVIRVRQHRAVMMKDILTTALFLLLIVVAHRHLPPGVLIDNLTFYLSLVAAIRFTVLVDHGQCPDRRRRSGSEKFQHSVRTDSPLNDHRPSAAVVRQIVARIEPVSPSRACRYRWLDHQRCGAEATPRLVFNRRLDPWPAEMHLQSHRRIVCWTALPPR